MNRRTLISINISMSVPHTRGDEPIGKLQTMDVIPVFPTPVGMNHKPKAVAKEGERVPHTRGDEPEDYIDAE